MIQTHAEGLLKSTNLGLVDFLEFLPQSVGHSLLVLAFARHDLSHRTGDAAVGMLGYQFNRQLMLGYSYDYSVSKLRQYNGGSHELMLRYEFGYNVKAMSPRYF